MGFLERLKQQQETEVLARSQQEAELRRKKGAEEEARQRREAQERAFHEGRRQKAASLWQESGVDVLLSELREILQVYGRLEASNDPDFHSKFCGDSSYLQDELKKDPDSTTSAVFWDRRVIGHRTGAGSQWDECEGKFLVVEVLPEGSIIYHGKKDVIVPQAIWRDNKEAIEDQLEIAFKNSGLNKFRGNIDLNYDSGHD